MSIYILGIESSCDDTAAAVLKNNKVLANIIAGQEVHRKFGGVVPELASRAHQQNIVPVVDVALKTSGIGKRQLHAVAFTRGPGLLGSLLVGVSFAKAFALSLGIPLIEVDHLRAHIFSLFLSGDDEAVAAPSFPFLCLTVSGGHTQIVLVRSVDDIAVIGQTLDDAAGEAFDKAAKIMGLPYPGGPVVDKMAKEGNPDAFTFPKPVVPGLDFSFSGLKTSFLYLVRDKLRTDNDFIANNKADLCASIQRAIVDILMDKLVKASEKTGINEIAVAGGVSANSELRKTVLHTGDRMTWNVYIPGAVYSTDNAAMIAIAGYFKYLNNDFAGQEVVPYARSLSSKR